MGANVVVGCRVSTSATVYIMYYSACGRIYVTRYSIGVNALPHSSR